MAITRNVKRKIGSVDIYVGENMKARRNELGLSQGALAKSVGVTFQQIQKYENGINRISASRMYTVAKTLGVDVNYFFRGIEGENLESYRSSLFGKIDRDAAIMLELFSKIEDKKLRKSLLNILKSYSKR